MKITITTKKKPIDDRLGCLEFNNTYDLPDHKALFYIHRGEAMLYETKVNQDFPCVADGLTAQSSALDQGRAYVTKTVSESEIGEPKKRGRKKKEA